MNILVLNYEFYPIGGGGAPVSFDISKGLVEKGHKVTVVTMKYKGLPEYEIIDGIEIYRVRCIRSKVNVCYPWEQLSYLFSAALFLNKHLKEKKYDINHTHFVIPTGVLSKWVKRKYKIPYVLSAHGSDVPGHNTKRFTVLHKLLKGYWKTIVQKASYVTAPSEYLNNLMVSHCSDAEYRVIPNGLNMDQYQSGIKKKQILTVCRLQESKGVQDVLQALAQMDMKDWIYHIVGDGPYRGELEKLTDTLELQNKVIFHGRIENKSQELYQILSESAVYISASYFESFALAPLEAIASGAYPLLSDISAHRSLVKEGQYFFECQNIEGLKTRLNELLSSEVTVPCIDVARYDWEMIIPEFVKLLEKAKDQR